MSYAGQLIHRAAVSRPAVTRSQTGVKGPVYAPVAGMGSVRCLLVEGGLSRVQEMFGADVKADALVYFEKGADIRPRIHQSTGTNDFLAITELNGTVSLGTWAVMCVKDPGSMRKMRVAAVKRIAAT